jgi:micrococcal nuclease
VGRACRRLLALVVAASAIAACGSGAGGAPSSSSSGLPAGDHTTVERVVDGDTIVAPGGVRVRFIGMDTPETKDPRRPVGCFGAAASRRTEQLLPPGTRIVLVYDVDRYDRYGRTLAYVYRARDALFVNGALVRDGYAVVLTVPPNVAHADEFVAWEREARRRDAGLWGACK